MIANLNVYLPLIAGGTLRLLGVYRGKHPLLTGDVVFGDRSVGALESIGVPMPMAESGGNEQFFYFHGSLSPGRRLLFQNQVVVRGRTERGSVDFGPVPAGRRVSPAPIRDVRIEIGQALRATATQTGAVPLPDLPGAPVHSAGPGRDQRARALGRLTIDHCAVTPASRVLDVGSGLGVAAVFYGGYLDPAQGGCYWGFDVRSDWVDWCRREISTRYPHVQFTHADLHFPLDSATYVSPACNYRFPFADGSFDLVLLMSVFTHMLPHDVRHYLGEIARVLKPGGRCLISWFQLDEPARAALAAGRIKRRRHQFLVDYGEFRSTFRLVNVERAIAYDQQRIRQLYFGAGLAVAEVIPGRWTGRKGANDALLQDLVVAVRP
jgi:SAM-dependent methyltransferase